MSALSSVLARNSQLLDKWASDSADKGGDPFSAFFKQRLNRNRSGVQEALDRLSERFPNLSIGLGEPGEGVKDTGKKAEEAGDQVSLGDSILAGMVGDADLVKTVGDVISAFLDRSSASNLMDFQGSYAVRSLSISVTMVSYTESHYSQYGGELLGASDLRTNFHERLANMIRNFFDLDKTEDGESAGKAQKPSASSSAGAGGVAMWSIEMYYSAGYISSISDQGSGQDSSSENLLEAWKYSSSFSASFARSFSGFLPYALLGVNGGASPIGGSGDEGGVGSIADFLSGILANFGLENAGFRTGEDGFSVTMREHRNLLDELMELHRDKLNQGAPAEAAEEPAAAEAAAPAE